MGFVGSDEMRRLSASAAFDPEWYRKTYPDVDLTGLDPATHYLRYGHRMGRDPGPGLSTVFTRQAYGLKPEQEPVARLAWLARRGRNGAAPSHPRVLFAAAEVARRGEHERAIALAEQHLPPELAYTASILRANAAIARGDDDAWQRHVNTYLAQFGVSPIRLEGQGSIFDRLASAPLPAVTGGPLVTVIMPAWNAEKTVAKAVSSILNQTWRNLELLIVDDASEDGTWRILQEIAAGDDRVRIMRNKVNVGPYVSKNIALMQAKGEWITGQDADDWSMPDRLERHVSTAKRQGATVSLAHMVKIDATGRFSHLGRLNNVSLDGVARKAPISCLFERRLLLDTLGYWDTVRFGADSEMISRAQLVAGPAFHQSLDVAMICLDLDTSLTNHPTLGVSRSTGLSPVRLGYRESWSGWHKGSSSTEVAFLSFPQATRRYLAPEEMVVPYEVQLSTFS